MGGGGRNYNDLVCYFMDLSDICDKSDDSEEENESLLEIRVSNCIEMKNYAHEYCHCALYTYVCNINNG